MGKKKVKVRSPREDTSNTETSEISCNHIRKAIDHSFLKKPSHTHNLSCQDCVRKEISSGVQSEDQDVWVCLKCGHRGCGRWENQHAIKHYETPRSEPHCLVLSLNIGSVWCYICDSEVEYSSRGQLAQLVSNVRKQVLNETGNRTDNKEIKKKDTIVKDPTEQLNEEKEGSKKSQMSSSEQCVILKKQEAASTGKTGAVSVRGLSNLGNTCFFNAVMQSLSQTHLLRELLNQITDEKISLTITPSLSSELEPLQIQLDRPGSLTVAMCQLLNEIQETKKSVVTPKELFTQVCKKAPRFKGFQQQDSQELLRYLLDGMRAEEVMRIHSGIEEALKNSGKSLKAEPTKSVIKEYEKNCAPKSFVDQVFGGEMTSTVMCKECKTVSLVTEMFLDLSLPVADEPYRKKKTAQSHNSIPDNDQDGTESPVNGNEDMPTGAGSKYQLKKAKKQAKKQAKNQKRQLKLTGKINLDALINQNPDQGSTVGSGADDEQLERTQEISSTSDASTKEFQENEDEEPEQDVFPSVNNRFVLLSEDHTSNEVSEDQHCAEQEGLTEDLSAMSLKETPQGEMENGEDDANNGREYTVVDQDPALAFQTLALKPTLEDKMCSVESCLHHFTEVEQLTENNRLLCVSCAKRQSGQTSDGHKKAVYRDAVKQMLISRPPSVLTLHLKRFQQAGYSVAKMNRHVQFPHVLDLAPFCSLNCKGIKEGQTTVLYALYGIVEHSGTMRSGHYTAYVKCRSSTYNSIANGFGDSSNIPEASKGSWFYVSDSSFSPVTEAKVQTSQAYLLFYEKIS